MLEDTLLAFLMSSSGICGHRGPIDQLVCGTPSWEWALSWVTTFASEVCCFLAQKFSVVFADLGSHVWQASVAELYFVSVNQWV